MDNLSYKSDLYFNPKYVLGLIQTKSQKVYALQANRSPYINLLWG